MHTHLLACIQTVRHLPIALGKADPLKELGRGAVRQRLTGSVFVPQSTSFCPPRWYPRRQPQPEICSLPAAGVVLDPAGPGLLRLSAHHHRELAASSVPPHSGRGRRRACAVALTRWARAARCLASLPPFQRGGSSRQGLSESLCAPAWEQRDKLRQVFSLETGDSISAPMDRVAGFTK